jgi:hypothetical protein
MRSERREVIVAKESADENDRVFLAAVRRVEESLRSKGGFCEDAFQEAIVAAKMHRRKLSDTAANAKTEEDWVKLIWFTYKKRWRHGDPPIGGPLGAEPVSHPWTCERAVQAFFPTLTFERAAIVRLEAVSGGGVTVAQGEELVRILRLSGAACLCNIREEAFARLREFHPDLDNASRSDLVEVVREALPHLAKLTVEKMLRVIAFHWQLRDCYSKLNVEQKRVWDRVIESLNMTPDEVREEMRAEAGEKKEGRVGNWYHGGLRKIMRCLAKHGFEKEGLKKEGLL